MGNYEIFYFLFVDNNSYYTHVVKRILFGISLNDLPYLAVKRMSRRLFWNYKIQCNLECLNSSGPNKIVRITKCSDIRGRTVLCKNYIHVNII